MRYVRGIFFWTGVMRRDFGVQSGELSNGVAEMTNRESNTTQIQSLLDAAARGDTEAYDELIAVSASRMLVIARRMLGRHPHLRQWEQTDDVFQTATFRLYKSLRAVRPRDAKHFLRLAATQIRRTLIDMSRHYFGPHGPGANCAASLDVQRGQPSTEGNLQSWTAVHEAIDELPEAEHDVFALRWYCGLSHAEIAEALSISEVTSKRRWRAARFTLHSLLERKGVLSDFFRHSS